VLVLDAREGYLVWEALRRCPEGTVAASARNAEEAELIRQYAATLPEIERPLVAELPLESIASSSLEAAFGFSRFDLVVGRDILAARSPSLADGSAESSPAALLTLLASALPSAKLILAQSLPRESGRLSEAFADVLRADIAASLRDFEEWFYSRSDLRALGMDKAAMEESLHSSGLGAEIEVERASYPRFVSHEEIDAWLSPSASYGSSLLERLGDEEAARIAVALATAVDAFSRRPAAWPLSVLYVKLG